ncbi:YihY family inner membrane protein [Halogeometricum sp. S1BR25-6]|uniref:YihY family inner membrane protein n=1 Tax=Halogeometricum salsisoli TaxID=2950536 RepID=A0ABU2GGQ5_9EURY|nr:YhjD/YihY/BrkB family envelope integrity protein [Halogeometricum sp. S1BR25-6]MDS0299997.1 YihY family inner membrane protein [Halogeometricum sp. S1BR25-6]
MVDDSVDRVMKFQGGETTAVVRTVASRVREQNLTFLAGSLAYNAFVSLIPLLLLVVLLVSTVGSEVFATTVADLTESYLTPGAQTEIHAAIDNAGGEVGLSVTGTLILLWGALKLFRGLDTAFAEVYGTTDDGGIVKQLRDGLVAFVAIILSVAALALAGSAFAYFQLPLLHVLNPLFLLFGLSVAFLPMYYVFPDVEMTVREAAPGAVVAAGGWAVLEVGFQVYAANASQYEAYGVIGGILLVLTWLYFSGFILLVGATVNAVIRERKLEHRSASEADDPFASDEGAAEAVDGGETPPLGTDPRNATTPTEPNGRGESGEARAGTGPVGGPRGSVESERPIAMSADADADEDGEEAVRAPGRRDTERRTSGDDGGSFRNVGAAFLAGVVVGLVAVTAAAVRLAADP